MPSHIYIKPEDKAKLHKYRALASVYGYPQLSDLVMSLLQMWKEQLPQCQRCQKMLLGTDIYCSQCGVKK